MTQDFGSTTVPLILLLILFYSCRPVVALAMLNRQRQQELHRVFPDRTISECDVITTVTLGTPSAARDRQLPITAIMVILASHSITGHGLAMELRQRIARTLAAIDQRRPKLGDDCECDDERGHRPRLTFGPHCDDEHPFDEGWSPIKCGEPTTPIYGDSDAPVFGPEGNDGGWGSPIFHIWQRLVYGPEGGDRPGWARLTFGPEGGGRPGWSALFGDSDAPLFSPKDGGEPGWSPLTGKTLTLRGPLLSDEDDDDVKFAPSAGGDDTGYRPRRFSFGPNGGGEPRWMVFGFKPPMMPTEPPDGDGDSLWISFGPKDNGGPGFLPLFGPDGGTEPGWAALLCAIIYAPEGGDGTGWAVLLCVPVIFIGILTQHPKFDPEDTDDEVGCHHQIKQGESYAPLFGPEDGDETGWHHPIRRDVVMASLSMNRHPNLIDDDDEDYRLKFAPHEGDDDTWGCLKFGPTGGDDETWRHFARLTFGPQGEDETWDVITTTLGDRALRQPEALRILRAGRVGHPVFGDETELDGGYRPSFGDEDDNDGKGCRRPSTRPSFGPRDDEDEGFLRPRTDPAFGPEGDDEPGEYRPSWGGESELDGDGFLHPRTCKSRILRLGGETDLDGEGFSPIFGDNDHEEEEKGGWHHRYRRRFTAIGSLQHELIAC